MLCSPIAVGQRVQVPPQWLCWCPSLLGHKGMQPGGDLGGSIVKHLYLFNAGLKHISVLSGTVSKLQASILRLEQPLCQQPHSQQEVNSSILLTSFWLSGRHRPMMPLLSPWTAVPRPVCEASYITVHFSKRLRSFTHVARSHFPSPTLSCPLLAPSQRNKWPQSDLISTSNSLGIILETHPLS